VFNATQASEGARLVAWPAYPSVAQLATTRPAAPQPRREEPGHHREAARGRDQTGKRHDCRTQPRLAATGRSSGHWPRADPRGRLWLMEKTLTQITALVAFALISGPAAANQATKTAAQLAVEQFNGCADSLFKDEFDPAEIDYEFNLKKQAVLFLSAQWSSRDGTITILTRIRSLGRSAVKEMIMTQNGQSNDEPPPTAAKVKEYIGKVLEECPPEKGDYNCADAVIERFNGIEQIVRHNLEYPNVTVEKYTSGEQSFRASKDVRNAIDDYYLILNGTTDHKSFGWRTYRPLTPTAVEEALHNPPPRVAKNASDIRKLQACMESVAPYIEIIPH